MLRIRLTSFYSSMISKGAKQKEKIKGTLDIYQKAALAKLIPFKVGPKTKLLIFSAALPFVVGTVFFGMWTPDLSESRRNYLDIYQMGSMTFFTFYTGVLMGKFSKNPLIKLNSNISPCIFLRGYRCYWALFFFLAMNAGARLTESYILKEYYLMSILVSAFPLYYTYVNGYQIGFLPLNFFITVNMVIFFIGAVSFLNGIKLFSLKRKENRFISDFSKRIYLLQDANRLTLKNNKI